MKSTDRLRQFTYASHNVARVVPAITASIGAALLVALQIPWLDGPLDKLGLSNTEALRSTMIAVVLTTISGQVYELSTSVGRGAGGSRRVFRDTVELFPFLEERIAALKRSERDIDVFVAHLTGVLHFLSIFVQRPEFRDCRVRITASTARRGIARPILGDEWILDARRNVAIVQSLASSAQIQDRNSRLEIYEYDFPPAFYGVRLGNGDLLISFLGWSDNGRLRPKAGPWEYVPSSEQSASADGLRDLFASWFQRALCDSSDRLHLEDDRPHDESGTPAWWMVR